MDSLYSVQSISSLCSWISIGSGKNEIDKENFEINKLVAAAKNGNWDVVWEILGEPERPRKGYLINVIPENRRWGILHQAVFWNKLHILEKVLSYKTCDYEIPKKTCTFDNGEKGVKNPLEIAKMYSYGEMARVLSTGSQPLTNKGLETFQECSQAGQLPCFQLLSITIAAYKRAFHPKAIDPNKSLFEVMQEIFIDVDTSDKRWKAIQEKVCEAVEGVCDTTHKNIQASKTRKDFYAAVIKTYTEEYESRLYTYLNTAMRRQKEADYRPTARDLALGPYILMYEMLLLHWEELNKESKTTFRRMRVSQSDLNEYKVGKRFMWVSFVSSPALKENAIAFPTCEAPGDNVIIFQIDNSSPCLWQPRNIEAYAQYIENERTYPAGAHFQVMKRQQKGDGLNIDLKLLDY